MFKHTVVPALIFAIFFVLFTTRVQAAITSPLDIPGGNTKLWLDANDIDGDGNPGNNPSDGTGIATWVDKSGNGKNAVQASASNRPTYSLNGMNSKPVVTFAGGSPFQYFTAGTNADWNFLHNGNGSSIFIVVKSTLSDGNTDVILSTDYLGSGNGMTLYNEQLNPTKKFTYVAGGADVTIEKQIATLPHQISDFILHSIITKSTSNVYEHYADGAEVASQSVYKIAPSTGNAYDKLHIGVITGAGSWPLAGQIAEIIMYNRNLTVSERADVECYLQTKWGMTTSSCNDGIPVALTSFTSTTADGTYGVGQPINIRANFSEPILPGSTMTVTLNTGRSVTLSQIFANSLNGSYVPNVGESTSDLTVTSINSASVIDYSQTPVTSFSVPLTPNNIADTSALVVTTNMTQVPVFIIAGQSNALGRADLSQISRTDGTPSTKIYDQSLPAFATLVQGVNQHYTNPTTQFGPEMGAAYLYKDETPSGVPNLYIIKITEGNTFLKPYAAYNDWHPDSSGKLFDKLVTKAQSAFTQINNAGYTPNVLGVYWMQGENDAIFSNYADEYDTNLTYFISELRSRLGFSHLPFVIGKIGNQDPSAPYGDTVRAKEAAVVNADPYACLVDTDDLTKFDNVHFNAAGQMTIGERVWNALKDCDHDIPVLSAKTINSSTVTLTFNESINSYAVPSINSFTLKVNGSPRALTGTASISSNQILLTTTTPVIPTDTITIEYTVPGTNQIQDWSRNQLAAISTPVSVTNLTPDTTPPTIDSVTSTTSSGTYTIGQTVNITVNFSEAVTATGSVTVTLNNGGSCSFTISNATSGSCTYTVGAGQSVAQLNVSSISGVVADQNANTMIDFAVSTALSASKTITIYAPAPSSGGGAVPVYLLQNVNTSQLIPRKNVGQTESYCRISTTPLLRSGRNNSQDVILIQKMLRALGYEQKITGFYWLQTEKNIRTFQAKNNLIVTGIVGNMTTKKLNSYLCK